MRALRGAEENPATKSSADKTAGDQRRISRRNVMTSKNNNDKNVALAVADPYSSNSLVPMLVSGLVLIVIGMIAVAVLG
jgi:hypothetical protein